MTTEDPTFEDTTTAAAGQADSLGTQGDQLDDLDEVLGEWRDDASLATAMGTAIGDTRAAHLMTDRLQVFRRRVVQDALKQGTSAYWRRRAADFDRARPRKGDFLGAGGQARADEIDVRLQATRDVCLHRAALLELDVTDVL